MKRIIVVDNDQDILDIIELVLNNEGYEVFCLQTGDLVDRILVLQPDLILMDDWLSEERGSDLCKVLKNSPRSSQTPVLLFSAVQDIERIAKECCADGFIRKPFDIDELLETVQNYLAI